MEGLYAEVGVAGWDQGCGLADEKKVSYRTEEGEEKEFVYVCIAAGVPGRKEIEPCQHMEAG